MATALSPKSPDAGAPAGSWMNKLSATFQMSTASAKMDHYQKEILKPLGDGTPQQNAQIAPLLAGGDKELEKKLAEKGGLVRLAINARVDAEAKKLRAEGKRVDYFDLYRQEALGTFADMDKHKIPLTSDQVNLRNSINGFNESMATFQASTRTANR